MKNKFDFEIKQIKIVVGMAVKPFWGIKTSSTSGSCVPTVKWYNPRLGRGDGSVYNRLILKLKVVMTVLCGFLNSPIAKASTKYLFFFLTLAVKTVSLSAVVATVSDFAFNCLFKEVRAMTHSKKPNQTLFKPLTKTTAVILSATLLLTACQEDKPDKTTARGRGKYDARIIKHEVHSRFLSCYPLNPREKKKCIDKIADEYLKESYDREYNAYLQSFQSESEKLGFKYFLEEHGLSCKSVPHSPQLINSKENIYFISCSSGEKYFMQFDYDNKQWSVKDQGRGNNG